MEFDILKSPLFTDNVALLEKCWDQASDIVVAKSDLSRKGRHTARKWNDRDS